MASPPRDITDAELAVMRILWESNGCTVRQILDRLYPGGGASAHATVQKLLERLERKGCVSRDRSESVQQFQASVGRDEIVDRRLRAVADQLCDGSLAALLSHLVAPGRVPAKDRKVLRDFLARLDQESRESRS